MIPRFCRDVTSMVSYVAVADVEPDQQAFQTSCEFGLAISRRLPVATPTFHGPRRLCSLRECCSQGGTSLGGVAKCPPPPPGVLKTF
jgi:hypothetical protein